MNRIVFAFVIVVLLALLFGSVSAQSGGFAEPCTSAQLVAYVNSPEFNRSIALFNQFSDNGLTDQQIEAYADHAAAIMRRVPSLCLEASQVALLQSLMLTQSVSAWLALSQSTGFPVSYDTLYTVMNDGLEVMNSASALFGQWAQ